ncbi:MAG: NifB/NifX family molybdenum-iron cluster-binding protein, partial [Bacilli bacterium]|nr:NifB/NifX family molybdenum-iron cluster-binding protein [Bacilli bacterium]
LCLNQSFGRAPYFYIYDDESKEGYITKNEGMSSPHGAGIKAAQIVVDTKAKVVIAYRCGDAALLVLKEAGIELFGPISNNPKDNIIAYQAGTLSVIDEIHSGHNNRPDQ